jgi:hypothetical protein
MWVNPPLVDNIHAMAFPHLSVCFPTNRWRPGCPVHPPLQGSHPQPRCFFSPDLIGGFVVHQQPVTDVYIYINGLVKGKIYQNLILGRSCRFFLKPIQMNIIRAILNHLLNLLHPERQPKIATLAFRVWPPAFDQKPKTTSAGWWTHLIPKENVQLLYVH